MNTKSISFVLFILLFLVGGVLFYAVSKGGLDIRSRASGTQSCITMQTTICPANYVRSTPQPSGLYAGNIQCCKNTLTPTPTPSCTKEGQPFMQGTGISCCAGLERTLVVSGTANVICAKKGCGIEGKAPGSVGCCFGFHDENNKCVFNYNSNPCLSEGEGVSEGDKCCTGLTPKQVIPLTQQTCVKTGCVTEGKYILSNNECCSPLKIKKTILGKMCVE